MFSILTMATVENLLSLRRRLVKHTLAPVHLSEGAKINTPPSVSSLFPLLIKLETRTTISLFLPLEGHG